MHNLFKGDIEKIIQQCKYFFEEINERYFKQIKANTKSRLSRNYGNILSDTVAKFESSEDIDISQSNINEAESKRNKENLSDADTQEEKIEQVDSMEDETKKNHSEDHKENHTFKDETTKKQ